MTDKAILFRLGGDVRGLTKAMAEARQSLGLVGDGIAQLQDKLGSLAAMAVAGIGLTKLVADALEFADAVQKAADQTGLTVEQVQFLRFAAEQAGASVDSLTSLVSKMQRQIVEAGTGNKEAADTFAELGLSIADLMNMSPDEQFAAIAEKIAAIPNPAEQAAAAVGAFGKAGADSLPLIKQFAEQNEKLRSDMESLGGPVSADAIKAVDDIGDTASQAALGLKSMVTEILAVVAPAVIAGLEAVRDIIGGIRVISGDGGNAIVDLDNKIQELGASMDSIRRNNPFGGEFVDRMLVKMEAQRQALIAQQEALLGVGEAGKKIIPAMDDVTTNMDEVLASITAINIEFEDAEEAHQARLKAIREQAKYDAMRIEDELAAYKIQKMTDTEAQIAEAAKVHMSDQERFRNQTTQAQVAIVSEGLIAMTQGLTRESRAMFEINKAASLASAVVNTAQGVTKALSAYPPPLSFAMAAAQAAAGAVQIKAIASQKFGSSATAPSQVGTPVTPTAPQGGGGQDTLTLRGLTADQFFSGSAVAGLAKRLVEYQQDGGRVVIEG